MARTDNTLVIANALFDKKTYDAVVATIGGDYTLISTAIAAGKTNIFVKKGIYNEPSNLTITTPNVRITGEDKFSTKIVFPAATNGLVLYSNYAVIKGLYLDTKTNTWASAVVIGDGSTPWTPNLANGNFNTVDDCYVRWPDVYGAFSMYACWPSYTSGAATVAWFDANWLAEWNVVKNCIIEWYQTWDVVVFALQKNGKFINNRLIWGRLAYYMVRDCEANIFSENSLAEGVFIWWPAYNNKLTAFVYNSAGSFLKAENQLEHPVVYPAYSIRNNDINIIWNKSWYHWMGLVQCDHNNIRWNVDSCNFHWFYMNLCSGNNIPYLQVKDARQDSLNSRGSGIYLVGSVTDNNFGDITITETKTVNPMHTAFSNREDSTCTGNKVNNLTTRWLSADRNVWIQSNNWKITNADIQGWLYTGIYLSWASYCQLENIQCKNNTNDANNTWAEVWITGNATNNVIGKLITESTATNKAKYGVQFDLGSNNNTVLNHQNIWAVTSTYLDSWTGNVIGVSVTGSTLRNITQQNLWTNFNGATWVLEQEVTGLRVTLPILAGTYTIKITTKVFINTNTGNNSIRTRLWTDLVTMGNNTEYDNLYVWGAKTLETMTWIVVAAWIDLSSQKYVFYTIQNDVDALNFSISASGARSTIVVEIYK